ncbi:group II intron reverse transcriptase domain-containing protein [Candidatus Nomurabacteria bacterium]|nr:group II intron reverse transcriptase domain-containing protein [Candidatus Nomurabacteria bacterium]
MSKIIFQHTYNNIISLENLLEAWKEFVSGKRARKDVQEFERNLMANIISLHRDLAAKTYSHSKYQAFKISDPKPRDIHKASVRDRLLHHALHRTLSPFFTKTFISDSYSCQIGKGTHRALKRFGQFSKIVSRNDTRTAWVLKCDIKKFFANIDQMILLATIGKYIPDHDITWLLSVIVGSFDSGTKGVGLPLGNLTSQLLVNIYMNEFDQFVKHKLKVKYYIRYADDFAVISHDRTHLEMILPLMQDFLRKRLKLAMHPNKISMSTVASGVDFLGWVHFQDHRVLRAATKRRMFRNIEVQQGKEETVQSYLGLLSHGNTWKLQQKVQAKVTKTETVPLLDELLTP